MSVLKYILSAAILAGTVSAGAHTLPSLAVTDLSVSRTDNNTLVLTMNVQPEQYNLGINRELSLVPVVYNADSTRSAVMPEVILAGRARYIRYRRDGESLPAGATLLQSGRGDVFTYTAAIPFEDWMVRSTVAIDCREHGCCGRDERNVAVPVARLDYSPREYVAPDFIATPPQASGDKVVEISGQAYIDFRVNRTEIDPGYRKNPAELAKIIASINPVRDNPDATITDIYIKGFASPEGPYNNNVRLAKGRTEALRDYVMSRYAFAPSLFHLSSEPEDWDGLRDSLQNGILPHRAELLEIANSDLAPDVKDATMRRRFPQDYKYILEVIYPALRHSDYRIRYNIRQYTDIDEIRRVMRERPGNLSLNEFHLLAQSYPVGSDEYNEVYSVAVRMFPEDSVSNINAAVVALGKGQYDAVESYLSHVDASSPAVAYIRGVAAARRGDYDTARTLLTAASAAGLPQAPAALESLERHISLSNTVEYIDDRKPRTFTREK